MCESTSTEVYPAQNIDSVLGRCAGAKIFTQLDSTNAYWQIPIHEDSQDLTTFQTSSGAYKWLRATMGIRSCPAAYARISDYFCLSPEDVAAGRQTPGPRMDSSQFLSYLDDLTVATTSDRVHDHLDALEQLLTKLQFHGVTLKLKK